MCQLQMQIAEEGMKTKEFVNPKYGQSNFFMPLKYHGDGEVRVARVRILGSPL